MDVANGAAIAVALSLAFAGCGGGPEVTASDAGRASTPTTSVLPHRERNDRIAACMEGRGLTVERAGRSDGEADVGFDLSAVDVADPLVQQIIDDCEAYVPRGTRQRPVAPTPRSRGSTPTSTIDVYHACLEAGGLHPRAVDRGDAGDQAVETEFTAEDLDDPEFAAINRAGLDQASQAEAP